MYMVGLAASRFQIVGTQMSVFESAVIPGGAAGNGIYGVRFRGASFSFGIPLPAALIPALTGLAMIGGIGGFAARRRRLCQATA